MTSLSPPVSPSNPLAEIFELRGVFRQSLFTFVRVTFGKSINKPLREFIHWLFGDSMTVYYLTLFKDPLWLPDGRLAPAPAPRPRTDDEKREDDTRRRHEKTTREDDTRNATREEDANSNWSKTFRTL